MPATAGIDKFIIDNGKITLEKRVDFAVCRCCRGRLSYLPGCLRRVPQKPRTNVRVVSHVNIFVRTEKSIRDGKGSENNGGKALGQIIGGVVKQPDVQQMFRQCGHHGVKYEYVWTLRPLWITGQAQGTFRHNERTGLD